MVLVPLSLVVQAGAVVRRLNDLGKPGILVLLILVPCLWVFMLVYLLAAPGTLEAARPRGVRV
jgi:uncharacterized membrane protein YhaH (DUF805 family)